MYFFARSTRYDAKPAGVVFVLRMCTGVYFLYFQVAYLGPSRRLLDGCDKKWGVRAAEDIPVGSFVCTVAGQVRLQLCFMISACGCVRARGSCST